MRQATLKAPLALRGNRGPYLELMALYKYTRPKGRQALSQHCPQGHAKSPAPLRTPGGAKPRKEADGMATSLLKLRQLIFSPANQIRVCSSNPNRLIHDGCSASVSDKRPKAITSSRLGRAPSATGQQSSRCVPSGRPSSKTTRQFGSPLGESSPKAARAGLNSARADACHQAWRATAEAAACAGAPTIHGASTQTEEHDMATPRPQTAVCG